jgi:hypothetical protein
MHDPRIAPVGPGPQFPISIGAAPTLTVTSPTDGASTPAHGFVTFGNVDPEEAAVSAWLIDNQTGQRFDGQPTAPPLMVMPVPDWAFSGFGAPAGGYVLTVEAINLADNPPTKTNKHVTVTLT